MHLPSSAEVTSSDISHWQHDPQKELVVLLNPREVLENILTTFFRNFNLLDRSRPPSVATAKAKVVGAGAILRPVSSGKQDTFQLPDIQHNRNTILQTAKNLYRYHRSRHHDHFKKFATKEESLQNIPTDVNEAEWKFLVDYFSSDDFKRDTTTGKEPNFQKLWEITHMKPNGQWVTNASAEVNDKVKDVAEKIQEIEEGTDVDPIINAAFVQIMGEKSKYILGQGSEIKSASRISRNEIQEQLQAQQKEAEEERRKRESVESKLMEVKNQLEEERKNREVMEVRLVHDQKLLKESMMALVSHLQNPKNGLPASIFNIITTSTSSNETSFASLMNNNWVALTEKRSLEMRLPKLSSQGSKKTIPKELADANNQVFEKIHEELKARSMLRTAEETKNRLLSEKSSLEEKIVELEKKKSSEASERLLE
ncbi:hypothetical protein KY284_003940 [Solanum tuberosum]|nr:hypothetical protein KY284_003940 [Solanum tuberosum]